MHFDPDSFLVGHPFAITEAGLQELRAHIAARIALFNQQPSAALAEVVAAAQERNRQQGTRNRQRSTGVISIRGTISQHASGDTSASLVGGTSTEAVAEQLREFLADEDISKIVLDIDSPGGSSYGVTELATEIRKSRGTKPIVAHANGMMASAAYWIGSAADYVYSNPSGMVGSIGAYTIHQDVSAAGEKMGVRTTLISAGKYKVRGNSYEPLADDARAAIQERVNAAYEMFVADVAKGREVTEATVRNGYGEGDVLDAKRAKAAGMIDGIATLEQVITRDFKPRAAAGELEARAEAMAETFAEDVTEATAVLNGEAHEAAIGRMRRRRILDRAAAAPAGG